MTINPFVAGVFCTLFCEMFFILLYAILRAIKGGKR